MDTNRHTANRLDAYDSSLLTSTERALSALWSEILQIDDLPSAEADFFALGGDSMTMVMTEFRIMEEFHVKLPAEAMLTARTVRSLSSLIDEVAGSSQPMDAQSLTPMPT